YRFSISLVIVFVSFIILGFLLIKSKLNTKLILFFLLWLLASISIVLNIIPLDFTIAERWIYLPLIGFLGIVALFIVKIFNSSNSVHKTIAFSILSLFFISFSARTIYRTFDWQNPLTLFSHDVVLSNNSAELLNNYGVALYTAGDHNKAREEFSRALQLAPDNLWTLNNLGSIYAQEGNYKKAKSLYEKSIQKSPTSTAYENLAQIYSLTEKPSETLNFVKQALITFPNSAKLNQLAALSSQAINATDEARIYAQKSLILDSSPDNVNALQQIIK
ncbi:MAG: tetratricopeptide repeat protein, partial [Patescibacteria group bacterium]